MSKHLFNAEEVRAKVDVLRELGYPDSRIAAVLPACSLPSELERRVHDPAIEAAMRSRRLSESGPSW
jgi:hypothetical protein